VDFRWNEWNIEHVARHGVTPEAAEEVVQAATSPYPRRIADDKLLVWAASQQGELLQVIFVLDEDGSIFVLHARPLTERERRRYRRQS
jgi:uncharacterized DUF497 family protein